LNTYCTIITGNYYAYALSLLESLKTHCKQTVTLHVFVSDESIGKDFLRELRAQHKGLFFTFKDEVNTEMAIKLDQKYHSTYMDAYRWSMKPVFMNYLLQEKGYEKVIYLDCDLFFYSNPDFIFDLLEQDRVLLSPHWRCADNPQEDWTNFYLNFQGGIYNGGFVGINSKGNEVMNYWANLCLTLCVKDFEKGMYVDQKYLDILHSRFDGVGVLRHRGCNVATWNLADNKRSLNVSGEVMINEIYPIVFIHFTKGTMRGIINGADALLLPHFQKTTNALR
jgi:lipopolysaccharide biosynthesis glycosyltransferase